MKLTPHHENLQPEWIDYNGHLSEGYYVVIFGHATDAVMEQVGIDAHYRAATGCSLYTVEAHVRYLREVAPGTTPQVKTRVVGVDAKRLHLCHEMTVDGPLAATQEVMLVHVDQAQARSTLFPEHIKDTIKQLREPAPDYAGRAIGSPNR